MDVLWPGGTVNEAFIAWKETMLSEGFDVEPKGFMGDASDFDSLHNATTAHRMLSNYATKYKELLKTIKLLHVERPFAVPLEENGNVLYVGRLDKVFSWHNLVRFAEHKTTKSYKKDGPFRADYINSFSPNSQIDGYLYAGAVLYPENFRGVFVDAALVHKTIHNGFQIIPIEKSFELVDVWLYETKADVEDVRKEIKALETNRPQYEAMPYLPIFRRKTESCHQYAGCTYRELCKFHPNPLHLKEPPEYLMESKWEPFDELKLDEIGLGEEED
jgi:hypothetical protein